MDILSKAKVLVMNTSLSYDAECWTATLSNGMQVLLGYEIVQLSP